MKIRGRVECLKLINGGGDAILQGDWLISVPFRRKTNKQNRKDSAWPLYTYICKTNFFSPTSPPPPPPPPKKVPYPNQLITL